MLQEVMFEYRYVLVLVAAAIVYALTNWSKTKKLVYAGIIRAKSLAKDAVLHSGQEQEDWVVETVYPLLPLPIKVVISESLFRKLVKYTYDKAKDLLDDGVLNNSNGGSNELAG